MDKPAFPITAGNQVYAQGMTLRQWYAGQALAGVISVCIGDMIEFGETAESMFAKKAFAIADAMLEAEKDDG